MRRILAYVMAAGAVIGLTGCWPAPGQGPDRRAHNEYETGFDIDTVADFAELWTATTDETGPRGVGHPVMVDGNRVYVTSTRTVYSFDAATGALLWASMPDTSTPTYEEVDTDAIIHEETLYTSVRVSSLSWETALCSLTSGGCDTLGAEVPARLDAIRQTISPPLTVLLTRYVSLPGGGVGQYAWAYFGGPSVLVSEQPDAARPTLGMTQLFHAGIGTGTAPANGVRAFPTTGTGGGAAWSTPIDGTDATTPVLSLDGTTVFVGTDAGTVYALATAGGTVLWSAAVGTAVTASPALADGTLYVPTAAGPVVALTANGCGAATCTPLWSTTQASPSTVQPAVAAGVLFTGSDDGQVAAYDAAGCGQATCPAVWSDATGSRITGAPAVTSGRLFVGTQDGRLIAYTRPPTSP